MRRSRRPHNQSSLFSFLDVMVCTIGALIMLMLAMTLRIEKEAVERVTREHVAEPAEETPAVSIPADATIDLGLAQAEPLRPIVIQPPPVVEPPPAPPEPIDPDADVKILVGRLTAERDERKRYLERQQALLTSTHGALEQREGELGQLAVQVEEARTARSRLAQRAKQLEELWTGLSGQLAKTRGEVQRAKEAKSAAPSKYALLPFDGVSGTNRRPIYIEFRGDGVRFLPEDVRLTEDDFEGYSLGFNPLLAGSSALVNYWMVRDARAGRDEPPPYVLMIVRPSGIRYYPARLLLSKMTTPSGYELLEEDVELALPEPDPQAAAACRAAIERVRLARGRAKDGLAGAGPGSGSGFGAAGTPESVGGNARDVERDPREPALFRGGARPIDLVAPDLQRPEPRDPRRYEDDPAAPLDGPFAPPAGSLGRPGGAGRPPGESFARSDAAGGTPVRSGGAGSPRGEPTMPGTVAANGATGSTPPAADGAPGAAGNQPPPDAGPRFTPGMPGSAARRHGATNDLRHPAAGGGSDTNAGGAPAGNSSGAPGAGGPTSDRTGVAALPDVEMPWYRRPSLLRQSEQPRRRRWGHSDPQGTIGFEREVVVRADAGRIMIEHQVIDASPDRNEDDVLRDVLTAVETKARTWGPAPKKFYWSPALKFQVTPEGNRHYETLRGPLAQWGLSSKVEPLPQGR